MAQRRGIWQRWWRRAQSPALLPYDLPRLNGLLAQFAIAPLQVEPERQDQSQADQMRQILATLASQPRLRRRFSKALSEGADGGFARWWRQYGSRTPSDLPADPMRFTRVFAARLGDAVRQAMVARMDLRDAFPLGLTPAGWEGYLAWLFERGSTELGLTPEAILWFLFEQAEDPSLGLALTYRITPTWQQAIPDGLTPVGWPRLKAWLAGTYSALVPWLDAMDLPSREEAAPVGPGVNMLGFFHYPSGVQVEAWHTVEALDQAGYGVSLRDIPTLALPDPLPPPLLGMETYPVTLVKTGAGEPFDPLYRRAGLHPRTGVYRIALWSWELASFPPETMLSAKLVDEVWGVTNFVAEAIRKVVVDRPVYAMLPGLALPTPSRRSRADFALPPDRVVFLFLFDMGSVMERKNPLGLIQAYRRAFPQDDRTALVIKVSRGAARPQDYQRLSQAAAEAGVHLIDAVMSREDVLALINLSDIYVSLHRSEGLGLSLAEAMLLGKPTIATGYSGNLDFMTAENSLLVDYDRVLVGPGHPPYASQEFWAEPSLEHAATLLRWVVDHPEHARQLGLRGQVEASARFSFTAAGHRFAERIQAIQKDRSVPIGKEVA